MVRPKNSYYVTTPIYYVTAKPHVGSLYSMVLADVAARWQKLKGMNTYFLTGTDEHGQKIAQAAERAGKDPKVFVDSFIDDYKKIWREYHIAYDQFIRTTDQFHVKAVQKWLQDLIKKGDIYKGSYHGWYCTPCETFLTDKEVQDQLKNGLQVPLCPSCERPTIMLAEETYFFKLSAYQDKLLQFYKENPNFITPREKLQEVLRFVEGGLKDLSMSRTTITWGIPFPGDDKHVTYVWADALNNYITAVGYGQEGREKEFKEWWPADLHVMGKDIVRFHAVYWPAFLMASGLPLPKKLLVHGWILMGDKKMSKSLGNVADPEALCTQYGADAVRFYLTRHMAITQDSSFTIDDLEQKITSELANDLGNLLNRMLLLAQKHNLKEVHPPAQWSSAAQALRAQCIHEIESYSKAMNEYMYHVALSHLWRFINQVNAYFHAQEPWKVVVKDKEAFQEIISAVCHSLHTVGILAWPVMPEKMGYLLAALGYTIERKDMITPLSEDQWDKEYILHDTPPLFIKPEARKQGMQEEKPNFVQPLNELVAQADVISIEDVVKVHLMVGTITDYQEVPKSDKLAQLQVDFGPLGKRQILAGIRPHLTAAELLGKQCVFVVNLKPRTLMGLESHGMMLVGKSDQGKPSPVMVNGHVANGTRLQ
ncbi:MAG: methionine--tRNA ligase [Candidatus Babeliales bacterium]